MWLTANVYTQDTYQPQAPGNATLEHIDATRVFLLVSGAAIYIERQAAMHGYEHTDWQQEILYPPGSYTITRKSIQGVRARSALPGLPALVTIEAVGRGE